MNIAKTRKQQNIGDTDKNHKKTKTETHIQKKNNIKQPITTPSNIKNTNQ